MPTIMRKEIEHYPGPGSRNALYALLWLVFSLPLFSVLQAQENTIIEISGQVMDQQKKEPVADVSIQIKGSVNGTITSSTGAFVLRTKQKLPFTLVVSSVGFQPQELEVKESRQQAADRARYANRSRQRSGGNSFACGREHSEIPGGHREAGHPCDP